MEFRRLGLQRGRVGFIGFGLQGALGIHKVCVGLRISGSSGRFPRALPPSLNPRS